MEKLLQNIFNEALYKIQSGSYKLSPNNYNGEYNYTDEEEVIHWMLYETMKANKDKRYKKVLKYIKKPLDVKFNPKDFSIKEICLFISPQTKNTIDK